MLPNDTVDNESASAAFEWKVPQAAEQIIEDIYANFPRLLSWNFTPPNWGKSPIRKLWRRKVRSWTSEGGRAVWPRGPFRCLSARSHFGRSHFEFEVRGILQLQKRRWDVILHTEPENIACTWFGEICSCCCLARRNKFHQTTNKPNFRALYLPITFHSYSKKMN